jgi:serine/threonine protein kinase
VARALSYLHQHRIAHRDIKPENILVFGPTHFCLGDFGWACMGTLSRSTLAGTPEFIAPEVVDCPCPYDAPSVDLWALGVLMYELVFGSTPFVPGESRDDDDDENDEARNESGGPRSGNEDIFVKIRSFREPVVAPAPPLPAVVDYFTEALVLDFCSQLMKISPSERMKPDEALQHPILQIFHAIDAAAPAAATAAATATATTPPCASHSGASNAAVTASPSWSSRSSDTDYYYQTPRRSSGVALTYE